MSDNTITMQYQSYSLANFRNIPQMKKLSEQHLHEIEVVGSVLMFKTNNYVVEQLINWNDVPDDPIFILNFLQKEMLSEEHFQTMEETLNRTSNQKEIKEAANRIRMRLNPHSSGQLTHNIPTLYEEQLSGMQHKYKETVLFFPSEGQTCHAYCTFCFRWPQFVSLPPDMRFATREVEKLIEYVRQHEEVTDILFTGGDPLIMPAKVLAAYIDPILNARIPHLKTIRIGTKALGYWPYKFLTDSDAGEILSLLERIVKSGLHLAFMAHFTHPNEFSTDIVKEAIKKVQNTGAVIRTQAPLMRHINDDWVVWAEMWRKQVSLGMIPYYMFVARDTGAQQYFAVPLIRAWEIFRDAYKTQSGLGRTVRGPVMSSTPGKVEINGVAEIDGQKVFVLRFLQGRNPDWCYRPFFAKYDERAIWLDDLKPVGGKWDFFSKKKFFFEE